MTSAVSPLLYIALNTCCDILWIINKLTKSSTDTGINNFEALLHCFGYSRKVVGYAMKFLCELERISSI